MSNILRNRIDLTEWVIHFVHDRKPENSWEELQEIAELEGYEGDCRFPDYYDKTGYPHHLLSLYDEQEYFVEPDASAYDVLKKILHDGYIQTGWSMRNEYTPTIYGPRTAACFTEMPLYALIEYAKTRGVSTGYVGNYGIAFHRREIFCAGARPVIYGLTPAADHVPYGFDCEKNAYYASEDIRSNVLNVQHEVPWRRARNAEIADSEMYRYVYTNFSSDKDVDWMMEREWRWALPYNQVDVPGMSFFLDNSVSANFSEVVIIVATDDEQQDILNFLKMLHDSGSRNTGYAYNNHVLENAKVLSLETLERCGTDMSKLKLDDLKLAQLPRLPNIEVHQSTIELVKGAISKANCACDAAIKEYLQSYPDYNQEHDAWAKGTVYTKEVCEVTQSLLDQGLCSVYSDGKYRIWMNLGGSVRGYELYYAGLSAAARCLTKELGVRFYADVEYD